MRPLKRDPAPSRLAFRLERLMLTPAFRSFLRKGLPVIAAAGFAALWAAQPSNQALVTSGIDSIKLSLHQRPEFMVKAMAIEGASDTLDLEIRAVLPIDFPTSSFDLDLEEMRETVASLNAVERAALRIQPGGVLQVDVTPRIPVALWRHHDGLRMIDGTGAFVAPVGHRMDRPDLPLIAGDGVKDHLSEALMLYAAAGPLSDRVRGLVRMGERRWDLVLDRDQRILLPTEDALAAFQRVITLHEARDLLDRDVAVVDMRNPDRPTVRMTPRASEDFRRISGVPILEGQ